MKILERTIAMLVLCATVVPIAAQAEKPPAANSAAADFANLARYRKDDNKLLQQGSPTKVVFIGDSITERWHKSDWFRYSGWVNRGIGGQTTSQILLREYADAVRLLPQAIVLEGGGNDMRLGFAPEAIRDNFASIGDIASSNHIRVFIAAMTPVCDCFRRLTGFRTPQNVQRLNAMLKQLCSEHGWTYLDFYAPLADDQGKMRKELTVDGVHPNDTGFALLSKVVEQKLKRYR